MISESGQWIEEGRIEDENKAGEIWAIALSGDGHYLASTTYDGRINVWDLANGRRKINEFETKGSFGMSIDLSRDGRFTASGHEDGGVYLFNNETGKMVFSLPSTYTLPVHACALINRSRSPRHRTNRSVLAWRLSSCCSWRFTHHYSL